MDLIGGASRDRTDDLIVANDNVSGSTLSLIQILTSNSASNHGKLLGRNWDVRGDVGVLPQHQIAGHNENSHTSEGRAVEHISACRSQSINQARDDYCNLLEPAPRMVRARMVLILKVLSSRMARHSFNY